MCIVHDPDGEQRTLATTVDMADSVRQKVVGLMGRSSVPEDYALVFPFDDASRRIIHTVFVRTPIDVVWLDDGRVVQVKTLSPWTGLGMASADTVVELPAGTADAVAVGDDVIIES